MPAGLPSFWGVSDFWAVREGGGWACRPNGRQARRWSDVRPGCPLLRRRIGECLGAVSDLFFGLVEGVEHLDCQIFDGRQRAEAFPGPALDFGRVSPEEGRRAADDVSAGQSEV